MSVNLEPGRSIRCSGLIEGISICRVGMDRGLVLWGFAKTLSSPQCLFGVSNMEARSLTSLLGGVAFSILLGIEHPTGHLLGPLKGRGGGYTKRQLALNNRTVLGLGRGSHLSQEEPTMY